MATRSGAEIGELNAGKVDLVVHGALNTGGSGWVKFEPIDVPPSTTDGDEWGGIYFDWMAGSSTMSNADIGYALRPLLLYGPEEMILEDCRVHHFKERGIWVFASGKSLIGNTVFRDTTGTALLNQDYGNEGIVVEKAVDGLLQGNRVILSGMFNDDGGSAIRILNTKSWCEAQSGSADTLRLAANAVIGPGATEDTGDAAWPGIRADWGCANGSARVLLTHNEVTDWNKAAFELSQCADMKLSENIAQDCVVALNFSRDTVPQGSAVRLRSNCLEIGNYTTQNPAPPQAVIRVNNATMLAVGPDSSAFGSGRNKLLAVGPTKLIYENDSDTADSLDARVNYWSRNGTKHTNADSIRAHIEFENYSSSPTQAKVSGALNLMPTCTTPGSGMVPGRQDAVDPSGEHPQTLPVVQETTLNLVGGFNPLAPGTEIRFSLAADAGPTVRVEVFDVTGRRVRTLAEGPLPPGRYGVRWDGSNEAGVRVGSGVYFVRLKGGGVSLVRKLVLVR